MLLLRGVKYVRQGKKSKSLPFFTTFLTTFILVIISFDSSEGDFWLVQKRREGAEIPVLEVVLTYSTFSKFPPHNVCHICAPQIFTYENLGNYLKNVWCCPHWSRGRFRKENRDFRISNIAKFAVNPSPVFKTPIFFTALRPSSVQFEPNEASKKIVS